MSELLLQNSDLSYFGRFYNQIIFSLARNWVIINLETKVTSLMPNESALCLNSDCQSLEVSWKSLGFNFSFQSTDKCYEFYIPGEIHSFNLSQDSFSIEVSTLEMEKRSFDLKRDLDELQSIQSRAQLTRHQMNEKFAMNIISYPSLENSQDCLVYLHGGPFQRFTNERNRLIQLLNQSGWSIEVPQYCGDPTVDNDFIGERPDTELQLHQLSSLFDSLKLRYDNVICLSHSYGCYLAKQLLDKGTIGILVSINGVFDLDTLKKISPKTFDITNNQKPQKDHTQEYSSWAHFHSKNDGIVPLSDLYLSLKGSDTQPDQLEIFDSSEHEILDANQQNLIIDKIHQLRTENKKRR